MAETRPRILVWVDLETTGLDAQVDDILELAAIITDFQLNKLGSLHLYGRLKPAALRRMKQTKMVKYRRGRRQETAVTLYQVHKDNGLLDKLKDNSRPPQSIDRRMAALIDEHTGKNEIAYLAGNSIHKDREFIRRYLPLSDSRLHYRMLDVSAFKVWVQGAYNKQYHSASHNHRALSDIKNSIAELKYYLKFFSNGLNLR